MTTKRSSKRILKITGIITGTLLVLLFAFHTWINNNARHIIEDLVESRSKGRLKMKLEKFRFSWFSRKVELTNAVIYTADSVNAVTAYRFQVQHIKLSVQKIWPIIFDKKLLIDSLNLEQPEINVTRLKRLPTDTISKKEVSIPEELGKIYTSIQDALQALKVNRFQIDNAKFTLLNKIRPGQLPLSISNIHFHIDNLSVDTGILKGNEKLFFSDNVVLNARNQDIVFPDGRHRLAFSNFRINLKQQLVEFDSCTMVTEQKDRGNSRFRVFFDTLRLAKIDFDTLYRSEVIKADTVYCLNPRFNLEVEGNSRRKPGEKRAAPKLEEIVQQLTGDLLLDHVIVKNADFHIKTNFDQRPASFDFTRNNFELQGLKVSQHDPRPLTVKSVALAIRNYENFIRDSTYKLKFDSIVIREDRVYLDRFAFQKRAGGKITNSFSIPRFELSGLSWDDLVFNQQLKAREATLYQPAINYNAAGNGTATGKGKKSIFSTLADIGQLIQLEKMNIIHGRIDIGLKNNTAIQLEDASMTIRTNPLFQAKKARAIEHAVDYLEFSTGRIKSGKLEIQLDKVRYTGNKNGFLLARKARVKDRESRMDITAENAAVDDILTDEETGDIAATGIRWDKADVWLLLQAEGQQASKQPAIELNDLSGTNTRLLISSGPRTIRSFIDELKLDRFISEQGKPLSLLNPALRGSYFELKDSNTLFSVKQFNAADHQLSVLKDVVYEHASKQQQTTLHIPSVSIIPDVNAMLQGRYLMDELVLDKPVLVTTMKDEGRPSFLPSLKIGRLLINQPEIRFSLSGRQGAIRIDWNGAIEKDNKAEILQLEVRTDQPELRVRSLELNLNHFRYQSPGGKHYDAGTGKIETLISNLVYHPPSDEPADWAAMVTHFNARQFIMDSLGRNNGVLKVETAFIRELAINHDIITDPYRLIAGNTRFRLEGFTGQYRNRISQFNWQHAGYSQLSRMITLDSFAYRHSLDLDSFMAVQPYQKDYITVGSGPMQIGPVSRQHFLQDSVFQIGKINIERAWFTDYKDKRLPFAAGNIRYLPVNLVKHIPFKIAADSIQINRGTVDYTEYSEKTNAAGTIPIRRMDILLLKVKNHGINKQDSLTIRATGYVMDSIWVQLRLKESYTDSLGGFKMYLRAKAGDLTVLNPALIPLVSAKLISGEVDTLTMRAVGREYLTIGEMKMPYKNLKFRYLKTGRDEKQRFSTRVLNFLANTLVIRKNNSSRTGHVFALRLRDRSAINYLLRIALSGMSSSAGVNKNKKLYRRYLQELEKKGLPPPGFE